MILEIEHEVHMPKVLWSGIQIDSDERDRLNIAFADRLKPLLESGWQQSNKPPVGTPADPLPDHMTIVAMQELPQDMKHLLGTQQFLRVIGWGQSDQAAAVLVESTVKSLNAKPHITMAVSPTGKPFNSNQITDWVELSPSERIVVRGKVVEKTVG